MNVTYERIVQLCKDRGTTYNAVCKELNMFPSVIGNLKQSETRVLKADTALAFANYFGVSVDYLFGKEMTATNGDGQQIEPDSISDKDKRLLEWFRSLSPEKQRAILIAQDAPEDVT